MSHILTDIRETKNISANYLLANQRHLCRLPMASYVKYHGKYFVIRNNQLSYWG